jgi:ribosomal protein S18 acetylase RimI-like enzyme
VATSGERTLRFSGGWARVGPWRGRPEVAHLVLGTDTPATSDAVEDCAARLRADGYRAVVTSAVATADSLAFLDAGFEVRERLHLLEHRLRNLPKPRGDEPPMRRAWRGDRAAVVALDARAFDPFWQLDEPGLREALRATPSVRFRVGSPAGEVAAYAITGRAGRHGYVQRIAVDPGLRRQGWARTLLFDALRWLARHDVERALVNTQLDNDGALALYESSGFTRLPAGLCVLGRTL